MTTLADWPIQSAAISECARYRYSLVRQWGRRQRCVAWVMLHPFADEASDDQTTRCVVEFSRRWGFDRLEVVNLFAYRANNLKELLVVEDPVGPENRWYVHRAVTNAELVIVAWGDEISDVQSLPETLEDLARLRQANTAMLCFGLTESGQPLHPDQLSDSTVPVVWGAR